MPPRAVLSSFASTSPLSGSAFEKMRAAQPAPKYEGEEPPLPKHW